MALLDISLETANRLYAWGWRGSLVGAVVTALSLVLLMWGTRVRDHDSERQFTSLNRESSEARERASNLEAQSATLQKEAADARLETERLRAQMAWRRISPDQAAIISKAIREAGLKPAIFLTTTDPEANRLRDDLVAVLKAAGDANPRWSAGLSGGSFAGLAVTGPDLESKNIVGKAFKEAGMEMVDGGEAEKLTIVIGAKPPIQP